MKELKVSVVVTVRNEKASITTLLQTLVDQSFPPREILISDGGSTDGTAEIVQQWIDRGAPIRLLRCPGSNIAAGRNRAIEAADGDVIACTDAGTRLHPDWLARIVAPIQNGADVSMGFFIAEPRSVFELALGATILPDVDEIKPNRFIPSSRSIAFTRDAWRATGGYPEWLDYCEDVVFDLALRRAGFRFGWAPDATVAYRPRTSVGAYFRQYYLYARGDGKANLWWRRHVIRYATYVVAPLVFVAGFWYNRAWLALLLGAGLYLYRPYRRLFRALSGQRPRDWVVAAGLVPILRMVGDVAKMIGYPVGVWWRLKHARRGGVRSQGNC